MNSSSRTRGLKAVASKKLDLRSGGRRRHAGGTPLPMPCHHVVSGASARVGEGVGALLVFAAASPAVAASVLCRQPPSFHGSPAKPACASHVLQRRPTVHACAFTHRHAWPFCGMADWVEGAHAQDALVRLIARSGPKNGHFMAFAQMALPQRAISGLELSSSGDRWKVRSAGGRSNRNSLSESSSACTSGRSG